MTLLLGFAFSVVLGIVLAPGWFAVAAILLFIIFLIEVSS